MAKTIHSILWSLFLAAWVVCDEGPCFQFPDNTFVHFTPNGYDNSDRIHYSMQIKPAEDYENGVLMYSRGPDGDDEALYLRGGQLNYHIFNTEPSGVGSQFGGHFAIREQVPANEWTTVHVYRMWTVRDAARRRSFNQTGIKATINGQEFTSMDHRNREGITLDDTVYFGGYRESLSTTVLNFTGQIRDMQEEKNGAVFSTPSLNFDSQVDSPCSD